MHKHAVRISLKDLYLVCWWDQSGDKMWRGSSVKVSRNGLLNHLRRITNFDAFLFPFARMMMDTNVSVINYCIFYEKSIIQRFGGNKRIVLGLMTPYRCRLVLSMYLSREYWRNHSGKWASKSDVSQLSCSLTAVKFSILKLF